MWKVFKSLLRSAGLMRSDDTARGTVLLEDRNLSSAESAARAILWTIDDVLPWHVDRQKAGCHLIRSQEELEELWQSHGGDSARLPKVDFSSEMVAAIFVDPGEYYEAPGIRRVEKVDNQIHIVYSNTRKPWKMIDPGTAIKIPRADGDPVFVKE